MSRFSVSAIFKGIDRITAPMRRIQSQFSKFTDSAARAGRAANRSFSEALQGPVRFADGAISAFRRVGIAAGVFTAAIAGIGRSIIGTGAEFDQTLMGAVARFPGEIQRGTEAFNRLSAAAEEVGATTEFDAQQAAGALRVFAAATFSAETAVASLAAAGDLATVSGMTLDDAAKSAADSLGALGLRSEDAAVQAANFARLNDVMARSTSLANTSVQEMTEAIANGGSTAINAGASVETFGALVAAMASSNIKGAEAGTAIRNMFTQLERAGGRAGGRASATLERLHVATRENGNLRDMTAILGDLSTAMADMGTAEKGEAIANIFGVEAVPAVLAAMSAGEAGLSRMRTELENAHGAAGRMAATMRDTAAGDIDGFTSAIDGVKTAIFGLVQGPFRSLLQKMTRWIGANREAIASGIGGFVRGLATNFDTLAQRAKGLAVAVAGFGAIVTFIKAAALATEAWATYQAILNGTIALNPYVAIAMAIVAAIGLIVAYWPEITAYFQELWQDVQWLGGEISKWFEEAWASVVDGASAMWASVTGFFSGIWDTVSGGASDAGSSISDFFGGIWNSIKAFATGVVEFVVGAFVLVAMGIRNHFAPQIEMVLAAADWVMEKWNQFSMLFNAMWMVISFTVNQVWTEARDYVVGIVTSIVTTVTGIWARLVAGVQIVGSSIKTAFTGAWNWVVEKAQAAYGLILSIWNPIAGFFQGLWDGIYSAFVSVFSRIGAFLSNIVGSITGVVTAIQGVGADALDGDAGGTASAPTPQVVAPGGGGAAGGAGGGSSNSTSTIIVSPEPGAQARVARHRGSASPPVVRRTGRAA